MEIKLFDDAWFDCYAAFLNNIIYSLDCKRTDRLYCNNYTYIKPREEAEGILHFNSINTEIFKPEKIEEALFETIEEQEIQDEAQLFQWIYDNLNEQKQVLVELDMYDYLPSYTNIYHKNHVIHFAHVAGYNSDTKLFTVFERGIETLPKEKLLRACLAAGGRITIFKLRDKIELEPVTLEEVKTNAQALISSIDELLDQYDVWDIEDGSKKDMDYFLAIPCCTHIESIKWRNYANQKLAAHFELGKEVEAMFERIQQEAESLQKRLMYDCVRYCWDNLECYKEELRQILLKEKYAWELVVRPCEKIEKQGNDLYSEIMKAAENSMNQIAIQQNGELCTYEKLFQRADEYAQMILEQHLPVNSTICIIGKKSISVIACMLGILKSGSSYLVLDADMPVNHNLYRIENSDAALIFIQDRVSGLYSCKNQIPLDWRVSVRKEIPCERKDDYIAYGVYTSGTTGKPKQIIVEDRNILAYVRTYIKMFHVTSEDVMLQQSPVYYDGFAEEVYVALLTGGRIVIPKDNELYSPRLLHRFIKQNKITIVPTTPIILNELNQLPDLESVRMFVSSGDQLRKKNFSHIVKYSNVYNMYGPSETTVCATVYQCLTEEQEEVPIGKAIEGYDVFLLDGDREVTQTGEMGEICISGAGVARGYYKAAAKAGQSFVIRNGKRIYRTGDYGWKDHRGVLMFYGRMDRIVKIRGNKISLDEIEEDMKKCEGIEQLILFTIDERNEKILCAFYQSENSAVDDIKKLFQQQYPEYACPKYIKRVREIPISQTGKVNYNAMKEMIRTEIEACREKERIVPDDTMSTSKKVMYLIQSVVNGGAACDINENSNMKDIGIDSIAFIRLIVAVEDTFQFKFSEERLDYRTFITVNDLVQYIESNLENK